MKINSPPLFWLMLGALLLPLMVTRESLWIDEADTAMYAVQPDFRSWRQHLSQDGGASSQMPLAMFVAWVGGRVLGTQEWQLRIVNIVWGALALLGMYQVGKRIQLPWLPLLLAIQPYFWFYMNEARPYALQIACGAWLLAGFVDFVLLGGKGESWAWLFCVAAMCLSMATMLAPLPILATAIVGGVMAIWRGWQISRKSVFILLGAAVAHVPIAFYYLSTLARGAQGARVWQVDLKFFGYVIYELTGMTGLGLPINTIREIARSGQLAGALVQHALPLLLPAICLLVLAVVLVWGMRRCNGDAQAALYTGIIAVLAITSLVFVVVGVSIQKAFWARHFAPVFPFYVSLLGMAVCGLLRTRNPFVKILPVLLLGLLLFSALSLRFAARHRKEDYRSAAQIARQALEAGKSVWWVASPLPAHYYRLEYETAHPTSGKVFCPPFDGVEEFPAPDIIIYSKPDLFDPKGAVKKLILEKQYRQVKQLPSFVIWSKQSEQQ